MMRNRKNITGINTRITILADIIQKARVVLCADNERIYLNAEETRKIILMSMSILSSFRSPIQKRRIQKLHLTTNCSEMNLYNENGAVG